jgi:2-isopropylmalate synthase
VPEDYTVEKIAVKSGTHDKPTAKVQLKYKGQNIKTVATGAGPVDAVYQAIASLTKVKAKLIDYSIQAITGGTDALGEVTVRLEGKNRIFVGHGADTDIIVASAKAYLAAINRLLYASTK